MIQKMWILSCAVIVAWEQEELTTLTEVWHIAHFWVSYGRCAMPGLCMGWSEGLSWQWAD